MASTQNVLREPLGANHASRPRIGKMLNKVPEVTLYFWVIKILATTVGETAADYLDSTIGSGLTWTTLIMTGFLIVALCFQFRLRLYVPFIYWLSVVLISIVGTLITDNLVDNYGVTLPTTTIAFSITLAVVFAIWYWNEKTLSIHTIVTTKREAFYWSAVLFTFALGTAAGDLTAERLSVGYWKSRRSSSRIDCSTSTRSSRSGSPTSSLARSAHRSATTSRSQPLTAAAGWGRR
jgi:uncharacterized membrane-anchored protein